MDKQTIIKQLVPEQVSAGLHADAFAPSNIALCKYWGKRNAELNLPINSSLSISLGELGTRTTISPASGTVDQIFLNGIEQPLDSVFSSKIIAFVNLFRRQLQQPLKIETQNTIPTAAGLASSASGFAALALALNQFYQLNLRDTELSICARLGSGSASRSVFSGFVRWEQGQQDDGMDSCASPLAIEWPEFRLGLLKISLAEKAVDSRTGMARTLETSELYQSWPKQSEADIEKLEQAIFSKNFKCLGEVAEQNAMSMHATMLSAWPPLFYWRAETLLAVQKVWALRAEGLPLYCTLDAGPNIKLLFEVEHQQEVLSAFPEMELVVPFFDR